MLCTNCGYLNPPFTDICRECHSIMAIRKDPPVQDDRFQFLCNAVKKVRNRQMSSGEFRDLLVEFENRFNCVLVEVGQIELSDDYAVEFKDEVNMGTGGIKLFLEAVREMHLYLDTRQDIYLDRGLAMAKDANSRLNEALRLNWEYFRNIQETAEEFMRTQSAI